MLLIFLPIRPFRLLEQFFDLALQSLLFLFDPVIAHRFVLARVGLHLHTVDAHPAQLDQPAVLCDLHHLLEKPDELLKMLLSKITDRSMLRKVPRCQYPKRYILFDLLRDLSRGDVPVEYA